MVDPSFWWATIAMPLHQFGNYKFIWRVTTLQCQIQLELLHPCPFNSLVFHVWNPSPPKDVQFMECVFTALLRGNGFLPDVFSWEREVVQQQERVRIYPSRVGVAERYYWPLRKLEGRYAFRSPLWLLVFIHYTDIDDEVRLLIPTTKVEFDCEFEESGPVARNVRKIIPKKKKVLGFRNGFILVDGNRTLAQRTRWIRRACKAERVHVIQSMDISPTHILRGNCAEDQCALFCWPYWISRRAEKPSRIHHHGEWPYSWARTSSSVR